MRFGRIVAAIIVLIDVISLAVSPRATAAPSTTPICQPYVPVDTNVLPPELSNPPIPHSGDPRIRTMCIRSKSTSAAPAESPVEFWCTLVVWPPAVEVGGLFLDAAPKLLLGNRGNGVLSGDFVVVGRENVATKFGVSMLWLDEFVL